MIERRKFARISLEKQVKINFKGKENFVKHMLHDVSLGGMFLKSQLALPPGSVFNFEFSIDKDLPKIRGRGVVVRIGSDDKGEPKGMGIEFISLEASGKELLANLIKDHLKDSSKT